MPGVHRGPGIAASERREQKGKGADYLPRTFKARQNAAAAERNSVIDAAKKLIEAAEQVISRATTSAKEMVGWFFNLAQTVGQKNLEQERKEQAERVAKDRQQAREKLQEEQAYKKRLQEAGQRQGGRRAR